MKKFIFFALVALLLLSGCKLEHDKTAFVHLFEWQWNDIAEECEQHLGPKGFSAIQVSPPQESINREEWWSRYQPVSYDILGRSGDRAEFRSMVKRCKKAGVVIYVDAVINHMSAAGFDYPKVPYDVSNFHDCEEDIDYNDRYQVQFCNLVGLKDLKTESEYVRQKIADYMNDMIRLGVAGFRIDAAKHIPTDDIAAIKTKLSRDVFIFQEVIGSGSEPIKPIEYVANGKVTEFNFERTLGYFFKGGGPIKELGNIGIWNGWLASEDAVVFVSNHDDQRQNPFGTLTYKDAPGLYYIGEIFQLAYPYGYPKVMSSYYFENHDQGPPANGVHSGDACGTGWVCEHRWRGIANMVAFRNATADEFRVTDWWDNGNNQIAFGRGGLGFIAINREDNQSLSQTLQTGMPEGDYCDIINGEFNADTQACNGPIVKVNSDGMATLNIVGFNASAIHVNAKAESCINCPTWENAYFRGSANAWEASAMAYTDGLWRTIQTFTGDNGTMQFKIDRFGDWSESYPQQNYIIAQGSGTYDITFNDVSKEVTATKQDIPLDVEVTFTCNNGNTVFGQSVYAIGSLPQLGNWNPADAILLGTNDGQVNYPTWQGAIILPGATNVEWKCFKRNDADPASDIEWQNGGNNTFNTGDTDSVSASF